MTTGEFEKRFEKLSEDHLAMEGDWITPEMIMKIIEEARKEIFDIITPFILAEEGETGDYPELDEVLRELREKLEKWFGEK